MSFGLRTSQSHPLVIDSVDTHPGFGRIGLTFCPGKTQPDARTGGWERDLALDLEAVAHWGAAAVVTLLEPHELDLLKVPTLGEEVARRHMSFLHLPIPDGAVPDDAFETAWTKAGEGLRARLRSGASVVLHCKGDLGRTGTIAARLLIELGIPLNEAVDRVRKARPGAIENAAQMAHVLNASYLPEPAPTADAANIEDRAVGALLGLAVGDALGTTLEFKSRDDATPRLVDIVGGGPFSLTAGCWTDDTSMALALADSLLAYQRFDSEDLMQRFLSWWQNGAYSPTGRCFDVGGTTRAALSRFKVNGNPMAGSADPDSAGNGSLMRLAPVAIRHWQDAEARRAVAAEQSRCTHAAAEAVDACVLYVDLIAEAIAGRRRSEILSPRDFEGAPTIAALAGGAWRGRHRSQIRGTGYVVRSLEAALWCIGQTTDFREAVVLAANLREDADTTAAITGQLAGALYGASAIPQEWRSKLAWGDRIEDTARQLFRAGAMVK